MLEEKDDNLQNADGQEPIRNEETVNESTTEATEANSTDQEEVVNTPESEDVHREIDDSNAEDAEDDDNLQRHSIPMADYHAMSMTNLVDEFEQLLKDHKVQAIKEHVDHIKSEFDLKYGQLLEEKKEDFIDKGGNEIDFSYHVPEKSKLNSLYNEYKERRNSYYKNIELTLKGNLEKRLVIIEELKSLINVEENINITYKHFKDLQEQWRNAGPVPRANYTDVWRNYQFHTEMFYDFLDLNRDLRDLDFKHNLEEKVKLIEKAEELSEEKDINKAFRELQLLHKVWKEDIGPVEREQREAIWERFSNATKIIHDRRQEYYQNIEKAYEQNLVRKQEIIKAIEEIAASKVTSHNQWQKLIKEIEKLREDFFSAGKVPAKVNEETWSDFKESVRTFNRNKNAFYKNLKKEQQDNLNKKLELVAIADANKGNEDFEVTTPLMKKIQEDWKHIGHVPRKHSDKVWKDFKAACNHYFNRLHSERNAAQKVEFEALDQKKEFLDNLKDYQLSGDSKKDLTDIKKFIADWKVIGRVPFNKRNIESKFNKIIDALFKKLDMDKQQAELIKYGNKLDHLASDENSGRQLQNEHTFIRRKIDEVKAEIRQLENNMQFFTNVDESNPLVRDVIKNINNHKESLAIWQEKLKKINSMAEDENEQE
ncbi:hypothetical protein NBRC110019_27460 [Neptunitalea chrysea]|uniref:DUF349 domain-containing protein n=1 Tax=Neptunitalea chrysea TaxID=1647581 RepID=A0A9W6EUM8_9FLAO|nr:DUF349 domain-containing protein [Neptunitalea chrysea]GLB53705.1 hypothetical protein NBRC110019_27460 [Neptunitalea chrysea]